MKKKAFTLIELLVVISIIALLLSIMVPALARVKEAGRRTVCMTHVQGLITAVYAYSMNYKDNIPSTDYRMNAAYNNMLYLSAATPGPDDMGWYALGRLHEERIVEDPDVFYCPSQKRLSFQKDRYWPLDSKGIPNVVPDDGGMWSGSGNRISVSAYMYGLIGEARDLDPEDRAKLEMSTLKLAKLKENALVTGAFMPIEMANGGEYLSSFAHSGRKGGVPAGFGDGHVEYVRLEQSVFEKTMDPTEVNIRADLYGADKFTACMMQLLGGNPRYMQKYYNVP